MEQAIEKYLETIKHICPNVKVKELNFIKNRVSVSELKAKEYYMEADVVQNNIGFIYKGLVRSFYINNEGKEISVRFMAENDFASNYPAFLTRQRSKYFFQCLEPSVILNLSYDLLQESYSKFPSMDRFGRLIAEEIIKMQQRRIEGFLFENAENRYLDFIKSNPTIFTRVSLSHLSTYLGIERPSLSRIRKKISSK
jgi:CRP/FNR family transcriptional regulator, anaerobic regulatory protein